MWPWEHAIVGYLAYSVFCHLYYRAAPGSSEALVVGFASVLPDVIDKPLAWSIGLFDTGYALGHSLFFSLPLVVGLGVLSRSGGHPRVGVAFAVGYLLHPVGDLVQLSASNGGVPYELMLWPLATFEPGGYTRGFAGNFLYLFGRYVADFVGGDLSTYMWLQLGIMGLTILLWLYDGAPVLREFVREFEHHVVRSND